MAYTSQSLLESRWGTTNISAWSDINETGEVNTTTIDNAVTSARREIDQALVRLYSVPFSDTVPDMIEEIATLLAAWYMYTTRGLRDEAEGKMESARLESTRLLNKLKQGHPLIDNAGALVGKKARTVPVVVNAPDINW